MARHSSPRVVGIRPGVNAPKILVVDDQPENRDWLMKLLAVIGFSVRCADNGEAAIRSWEEWNPQLILMDLHMPVMDGLEATRRIKETLPGKNTIIVALTASAMDQDRRAASQSSADDFLSKPCDEAELLEKLRVLLNIHYDYEAGDELASESVASDQLFDPARSLPLPLELIEGLRSAVANGNKKRLDALITNVREMENPGYAQLLQKLADKYEYDSLAQLLDEKGYQ
jgi:CheY-like chemotaxis protein